METKVSRLKWIKDGDADSNFFHMVATVRKNKRLINELEIEDGSCLRDQVIIVREISNLYCSVYQENVPCCLFIEGLNWYLVESQKVEWLE